MLAEDDGRGGRPLSGPAGLVISLSGGEYFHLIEVQVAPREAGRALVVPKRRRGYVVSTFQDRRSRCQPRSWMVTRRALSNAIGSGTCHRYMPNLCCESYRPSGRTTWFSPINGAVKVVYPLPGTSKSQAPPK